MNKVAFTNLSNIRKKVFLSPFCQMKKNYTLDRFARTKLQNSDI